MGGKGSVGDTRRVTFFPITQGPPDRSRRPVVMRWEFLLRGGKLAGVFERNHSGDTPLGDLRVLGQESRQWNFVVGQEHLRRILEYRKRSVVTLGEPHRPLTLAITKRWAAAKRLARGNWRNQEPPSATARNLGSGQLWRSFLVFIWHAVVFARAQRHTISVTLIMPSWGALTKSGSHRVLMHSADSRSRTLLKAQQASNVSWN